MQDIVAQLVELMQADDVGVKMPVVLDLHKLKVSPATSLADGAGTVVGVVVVKDVAGLDARKTIGVGGDDVDV